jgi:signal transduction histidine kinase
LKVLFSHANTAQRRLDSERTLAADVSHQLRSPLTALSLRLEQIVLSTAGTPIQAEAHAALGQVDRLVNLVEGLLKTWRATSDRNLTQIDISTFLIQVKQQWQSRLTASGREMELDCESDLIALGTYDVQEQVLSVLIENAIQHGAGKITISAKDYQAWILIEVSDEGPGIAQEIESTLMAKGATTTGTGLGLAWARNQVASDGGRLELRGLKPAVFGIFLIAEKSMGT